MTRVFQSKISLAHGPVPFYRGSRYLSGRRSVSWPAPGASSRRFICQKRYPNHLFVKVTAKKLNPKGQFVFTVDHFPLSTYAWFVLAGFIGRVVTQECHYQISRTAKLANPQCEDGFVRVATEIWDALCRIRISGEVRQIVDVIIRKTWGYNKKSDWISIGQFQGATGINRGNVSRALRRAIAMNIIVKNDDPVKNDDTLAVSYSINKDYEEWKGVVKKDGGRHFGCDPLVNNDAKPSSIMTNTIDSKDILTKDSNVEKDKIPYSEIISDLNKVLGTKYRDKTRETRRAIDRWWKQGFRLDDFKKVHRVKFDEWGDDAKMSKFLRPSTLYGSRFENYLNQDSTEAKEIDQSGLPPIRRDPTRKQGS